MSEKYIRVEELTDTLRSKKAAMGDTALDYVLGLTDDLPTYTPADILAGMWVPVSERLPKEGEVVIVYECGNTWSTGQFRGLHTLFHEERSHWRWKHHALKIVKWWMPKSAVPLPQPLKEDEG